jgi:predicted HAD superfamily phosphohydrolase YqeG
MRPLGRKLDLVTAEVVVASNETSPRVGLTAAELNVLWCLSP